MWHKTICLHIAECLLDNQQPLSQRIAVLQTFQSQYTCVVRSLLVGQSVFFLQSQVLETLVIGFDWVEVLNIFVEGLALGQQTVVVDLPDTEQMVHADGLLNGVESDSLGGLAAQ